MCFNFQWNRADTVNRLGLDLSSSVLRYSCTFSTDLQFFIPALKPFLGMGYESQLLMPSLFLKRIRPEQLKRIRLEQLLQDSSVPNPSIYFQDNYQQPVHICSEDRMEGELTVLSFRLERYGELWQRSYTQQC